MSELAIRFHVWMTSTLASLTEERGQDLVEYALWCGLIALTIVGIGALAAYAGIFSAMALGIQHCVDFKTSTACTPF